MKKNITLTIYTILKDKSDISNPLSIMDLKNEYDLLYDKNIDRRTIYQAIKDLIQYGIRIQKINEHRTPKYYLDNLFSLSETYYLLQLIDSSKSLSLIEANTMKDKIYQLSSKQTLKLLPEIYEANKNSNSTLDKIDLIIKVINDKHYISFKYFDMISNKKVYRKQGATYHLVPYGMQISDNKVYVILGSNNNQFYTYRLDKMDNITISDKINFNQPFSLQSYVRESNNMYHRKPTTITLQCSNKIYDQVIDNFDKIIISKYNEDNFIANITTSINPPLISWIIQFNNDITIIKPQKLKEEMINIATNLLNKYKEEL